jgi:ABC-type nickel/cobalt efflux system permease component RcnA
LSALRVCGLGARGDARASWPWLAGKDQPEHAGLAGARRLALMRVRACSLVLALAYGRLAATHILCLQCPLSAPLIARRRAQVFFMSYVILVVIVAINIIVAVLVESFMTSLAQDKLHQRLHLELVRPLHTRHPCSPAALQPCMPAKLKPQSKTSIFPEARTSQSYRPGFPTPEPRSILGPSSEVVCTRRVCINTTHTHTHTRTHARTHAHTHTHTHIPTAPRCTA